MSPSVAWWQQTAAYVKQEQRVGRQQTDNRTKGRRHHGSFVQKVASVKKTAQAESSQNAFTIQLCAS